MILLMSMREIADQDWKDGLSEPMELMGGFKEEDEFEKLIRQVDRENADDAKKRGRDAVKETYCWPIIRGRANMIGPLPGTSGRETGVTPLLLLCDGALLQWEAHARLRAYSQTRRP
jgi:hypothetical protein